MLFLVGWLFVGDLLLVVAGFAYLDWLAFGLVGLDFGCGCLRGGLLCLWWICVCDVLLVFVVALLAFSFEGVAWV